MNNPPTWRFFGEKEESMKMTMRTVCAAAAAMALSGCGVPKEEYQKATNDLAQVQQQLQQTRQELDTAQRAVAQKEADLNAANQQMQAWQEALKRYQKKLEELTSAKGSTAVKPPTGKTGTKTGTKTGAKTTTAKGKTGTHTAKKPATKPASE